MWGNLVKHVSHGHISRLLNCCVYFKPLLIGQMHFRQKMLLPVWIVIDIPSVYTLLIFLSLCVAVLYTQSGAGSRCCRGNKGSTGDSLYLSSECKYPNGCFSCGAHSSRTEDIHPSIHCEAAVSASLQVKCSYNVM